MQSIDLIKIDVEGCEQLILEGMGKYLGEFKPTMFIEILTDEMGQKVQQILDSYNYLYFRLDKFSAPQLVKNITASGDYNYLICEDHIAKRLNLNLAINSVE